MVHAVIPEFLTTMLIHLSMAFQVQDNPTLAALEWDKAFIKIPVKYSDYADVFLTDLAIELPENTGMNKHAIELIEGKQLSYRPIYALSLVELETLKTYIETHIKTSFIQYSKSPARVLIFFDTKPMAAFACASIIEIITIS